MRIRILISAAVFLLLTGPALRAQDLRDLDAALDTYEEICNQCFGLRERMRAGKQVAADAITPLLERLGGLRETLGKSRDEMSFEQLRRFESIRERYARAFNPALRPESSIPAGAVFTAAPDSVRGAVFPTAPRSRVNPGFRPAWHFGIHAGVGFPVFAPGLMVTADNTRWGVYAKGCVGVHWVKAAYSGRSDGTSDRGTLWTTGKERRFRFGVSAGGSWFPRPFLGIYAGAGYGQECIYWEDTAHEWVAITDLEKKGPQLDAGVLYRWRHLSAFAGLSTVAFQTLRFETGIGYRF